MNLNLTRQCAWRKLLPPAPRVYLKSEMADCEDLPEVVKLKGR